MQEWRDPSTWLSASAAAAGEGGADKVRAPAESIEAAPGGGWRDRARNHRNTFSRRRKNEG